MIDIKDMFACGVHYGHRSAFSNPKMANYIYGKKNDLEIIDLTQTAVMLGEALAFLDQLVRSGGRLVVVGTKQAAQSLVQKYGEEMEMPYVDQRWYAGTLTNFKTIRSSVDRLGELEKRFKAADFKGLTKKERLVLQRERAKLTLSLGGVRDLNTLPEAIFVVDVIQERIAIREANKLGIPVIGVVDTNCSPAGIDYVIPGNDDAISAIEYYLDCICQVVKAAKAELRVVQEKLEKRNMPVIKKSRAKDSALKVDEAPKQVVKKLDNEVVVEETSVKKVVKKVIKAQEAESDDNDDEIKIKKAEPVKKAVVKKFAKVDKKEASKSAAEKKALVNKKVGSKATKPSTKE